VVPLKLHQCCARDTSNSPPASCRLGVWLKDNAARRQHIPISVQAVNLAVTLALPISESVPRFNVEPSCRAAAKVGDSLDASVQTCMSDENTAHKELQKQWTQFPVVDRERCAALTAQVNASYVVLLHVS